MSSKGVVSNRNAGSGINETITELNSSILDFERWLERNGPSSYDPYDIWGTRYGLFSRRVYYKKGKLGVPLIAPLLLMEILWPGLRGLFVAKERFTTADGQLAMAFLNLYGLDQDPTHLAKARKLCEDLLASSVKGYSGHCWGYPFHWQNNTGLWRKNTPYITTTPYAFGAFLNLFSATGETRYREAAISVAKFVHDDLHDTPVGADAAASSYSPNDSGKVINASAYRAWVLFEAAYKLGVESYLTKAHRNLNFILQNQRADGAWLYALDSKGEAFIDHFHTCFVLKNLWKINQHLQSEAITGAIRRGYDYYRRELFDAEDQPKSFAIQPRTQLAKLEMYNMAEAITLGALLAEDIPEAFALAQKLAHRLRVNYQLRAGYFVTRVFTGGWRHTLPFLRWPQSQLFYSLTNLLVSAKRKSAAH